MSSYAVAESREELAQDMRIDVATNELKPILGEEFLIARSAKDNDQNKHFCDELDAAIEMPSPKSSAAPRVVNNHTGRAVAPYPRW